jgi:hypothetical protein
MGLVLVANAILALIFYKTLYVRQANIDTSKLDQLVPASGLKVCMDG